MHSGDLDNELDSGLIWKISFSRTVRGTPRFLENPKVTLMYIVRALKGKSNFDRTKYRKKGCKFRESKGDQKKKEKFNVPKSNGRVEYFIMKQQKIKQFMLLLYTFGKRHGRSSFDFILLLLLVWPYSLHYVVGHNSDD